ncbi:hypothetical protein PR048_012778, partial [Dryococelus australis]
MCIVMHSEKFSFTSASIRKLDNVGLPLQMALYVIEECKSKLSDFKGSIGQNAVLARNLGYTTFVSVCKILGEEEDDPPADHSPEKYHLLKFTSVMLCDFKRLFSSPYKNILSNRQDSMTTKNLQKYLSDSLLHFKE